MIYANLERDRLTKAQQQTTHELQHALRTLPIEVILKQIEVGLEARPDFTEETARKAAATFSGLHWDFL